MTVKTVIGDKSSQKHLDTAIAAVLNSKRLIFVSGAGVSCSAGIPDFRGINGLYASSGDNCTKVKGKDLFDVSLFRDASTTSAFYRFMANLQASAVDANPTKSHKLLRTLKERGSLLRNYTQNIDGLECRAGLTSGDRSQRKNDVIQLHGDVHSLKCILCSEVFAYGGEFQEKLSHGEAPECPLCLHKCAMRVAAGRRSVAVGTLKPNVVLYGENHPAGEAIAEACTSDLKRKPDCLVIAGTSLKVPGCKRLIKDFAKSVHEQKGLVIFVNLTEVSSSEWAKTIDIHVQCPSDSFVDCLKESRPSFFTRQATLKLPTTKNPELGKDRKRKRTTTDIMSCEVKSSENTASTVLRELNNLPSSCNATTIDGKSCISETDRLQKENISPLKRSIEDDLAPASRRSMRRCI